MTTEEKLEAMTIATLLKAGQEVSWNRIIRCFNTISTEKNTHRNYKAYKILDYFENNRKEITQLFLDKLDEDIKKAKRKCGINIE